METRRKPGKTIQLIRERLIKLFLPSKLLRNPSNTRFSYLVRISRLPRFNHRPTANDIGQDSEGIYGVRDFDRFRRSVIGCEGCAFNFVFTPQRVFRPSFGCPKYRGGLSAVPPTECRTFRPEMFVGRSRKPPVGPKGP